MHWIVQGMTSASAPGGMAPAGKADLMSELSFPASDPPGVTPEGGVHLDASALHQSVPGSFAVRQLLIDGLQAAYRLEASAQGWLPDLHAAVATPALRHHFDQLLGAAGYALEQLQRALACFGVSHDPADASVPPAVRAGLALPAPAGALFDLAAGVAVRTDRAVVLSTYGTLADVAGAAGLTEPLPFLRACAAAVREGLDKLNHFLADELVPAAVRADGAPLSDDFVRLAFGAVPAAQAEERR